MEDNTKLVTKQIKSCLALIQKYRFFLLRAEKEVNSTITEKKGTNINCSNKLQNKINIPYSHFCEYLGPTT